MLGLSRTIAGDRLVAFEFLQIVEHHGGLVYLAQANGRAPASEFTLTRLGAAGAVFENRRSDSPHIIKYTPEDNGTLTVVITNVLEPGPQRLVFRRFENPAKETE